jgi:ankyrin repeat protein
MVPKIDITIIKHLFELGVDPNIENNDGRRCIKWSVYTFRSDIFKLFLDYGADVNFKTHKW